MKFFRGTKATPPFPIPFTFLSFLFPFSTLPSPPHRVAHLNLARGFGEGCKFPQQEQSQTQNNLINVLTNTTNFGKTIPLTPPLQLLRGRIPVSQNSRPYVCKQRKLNYLKLHIQSTNTKRFLPVAVDNIIRDFVILETILVTVRPFADGGARTWDRNSKGHKLTTIYIVVVVYWRSCHA